MLAREEACELYMTWVNGNRKDVMRALTSMSSMRAACVGARIVVFFGLDIAKREDFIKMMERRLRE